MELFNVGAVAADLLYSLAGCLRSHVYIKAKCRMWKLNGRAEAIHGMIERDCRLFV